MPIPHELHLNPEHRESRKLEEMIASQARKLEKALATAKDNEQKHAAVYSFYRRYYTLTLNKISLEAGINKSPTRDIILDFPWKDLKLNRIFCLKIWEKINH